MMLHLLQRDRAGAEKLAHTLLEALQKVGHCQMCRTLTENGICNICQSSERDPSLLCIVESPSEMMAISGSTVYQGLFFVLNGKLSPLDGIGPKELGIPMLETRLASGKITEIILATNTTVEGEATAHYLGELAQKMGIRTTRLAYGMPYGGEIEYVDGVTLAHAFNLRKVI
jgi:recombination protein RecR